MKEDNNERDDDNGREASAPEEAESANNEDAGAVNETTNNKEEEPEEASVQKNKKDKNKKEQPNADNSSNDQQQQQKKKRMLRLGVVAVLVIVVIVVVVVVVCVVVLPKRQKSGASNSVESSTPPVVTTDSSSVPFVFEPQVSETQMAQNQDEFQTYLATIYESYTIPWDPTSSLTAAVQSSLDWVTGSSTYETFSSQQQQQRLLQRFVLGVLYYSTYQQSHDYLVQNNIQPKGWTSAQNWMSSVNECEWEGIECNNDTTNAVTAIHLSRHDLTGTLPPELAFLNESLVELDLSSNMIYVDGQESFEDEMEFRSTPLSPFEYLGKLTTLFLDDNFVVTKGSGLPVQFSALTNLETLVVSYNLLQGPFMHSNRVLGELSKLSHLSVESNFLTGDVPDTLLKSTALQYLYIRRNELTVNLERLLNQTSIPNIQTLWMDFNGLVNDTSTGNRLPDSIASHTNLASLSLSNCGLAGTIPDAMGTSLTKLRRIWLANNALSGILPNTLALLSDLEVLELNGNPLLTAAGGSMPEGVCQAIADSQFEFKTLTVDCDTISCDNCCTKCY